MGPGIVSAPPPPGPLSEPVDVPVPDVDPAPLVAVVVISDAPPKLVWAPGEGWQPASNSVRVYRGCTD